MELAITILSDHKKEWKCLVTLTIVIFNICLTNKIQISSRYYKDERRGRGRPWMLILLDRHEPDWRSGVGWII